MSFSEIPILLRIQPRGEVSLGLSITAIEKYPTKFPRVLYQLPVWLVRLVLPVLQHHSVVSKKLFEFLWNWGYPLNPVPTVENIILPKKTWPSFGGQKKPKPRRHRHSTLFCRKQRHRFEADFRFLVDPLVPASRLLRRWARQAGWRGPGF